MARFFHRSALTVLGLLAFGASAPAVQAQETLDVTFRFIPDLTPPGVSPLRVFVPGSFNDWGPNNSGQIAPDAPSLATYRPELNEYRYEVALEVGETYAYKIHYHENASGTQFTWLSDPLNEVTTGPNNDSVIEVADPMAFQLAREQNNGGEVTAVSAGLFATSGFTSIDYTVDGTAYADGLDHYDEESGIFRRTFSEPVALGSFSITATTDGGDTVTASTGIQAPNVIDQARPAGLKDGLTMAADGASATFSLYAPGKQFVYLLGDFNDWAVEQENSLFRDQTADGTWWWGEVTGLTPGQYYAFQYLIDGQLRIADPYSPLVLDPGGDGFIPDEVWPDLPDYPEEARGVAGLFRAGELAPFEFSDFERPDPEDLVVYELLVRDFLSDHSFETLADTLDYLERLGVNAVELMPVSEFDGNESWGYNPSFHLALDKYYGTPLAFKQFVEAAHQRGIAVILDVVYNHATGQSPLVQLYNEGDFGPPTADNPYANPEATHPFNVFNDLNHESAATQRWLDQANRWWIEEYNVDGYRYDLSKGFMQTGPWDGFNQSRVDLLTRMMDELWAVDEDAYVILEHLGDQAEERVLAQHGQDEGRPGATLWNKMNREYNQASMGYPTANDFPVDLSASYAPNAGYPLSGRIAYMESHDEQWMMWRNLAFGNSAGAYDVTELDVALERQKLAGAFFFPVPGPRMMWQFGELGYGGGPGECLVDGDYPGECESGVPGRVGAKPIRWDYWQPGVSPDPGEFGGALGTTSDEERELRQRLYKTWAALINLRTSYELFQSEETFVDMTVGRTALRSIVLRLVDAPEGEPSRALIFGNHGVEERLYQFGFDQTITWYDFFANTELTLEANEFYEVTLQPGEFHVWTDVDVPSPEMGLLGLPISNEEGAETPTAFGIDAAFPNPLTGIGTVRYGLAQPADVRVEVLDVLGRSVYSATEGARAAGVHTATVDAGRLPAGLYLVRVTAGDQSDVARITVAR